MSVLKKPSRADLDEHISISAMMYTVHYCECETFTPLKHLFWKTPSFELTSTQPVKS